jgi:hypothetical protein
VSRLPVHTVEIPDRPAFDAAGIVIARLRHLGIHPGRGLANVMIRQLSQEWVRGRMTDSDFDHSCRNMLILNKSLAL